MLRFFRPVHVACMVLLLVLVLVACVAPVPQPPGMELPEAASGLNAKAGWAFKHHAVAAANPLAARAGAQILDEGGTAMDAAVAVQMVLTLVEPQSSGIGGGAFLLHASGAQVQAFDGRETAPAGATEKLFITAQGQPMQRQAAMAGGRAVGVPGVVPMLELAHRLHGRLPWARLMQPAITLAEQGFALSPRLHTLLTSERESASALKSDAQARAYFFAADGQAHAVGHVLRNPALAQVLRRIAADGSRAMQSGPIAADIARRVQGHASNPGVLTVADLRDYAVQQREPVCTDWKSRFLVCGMGPPSSGHITIMQMLGILDVLLPVASTLVNDLPSADWLHHYLEAARLAFADRDQYIADPAFTTAPAGRWASLLEPSYLRQRAALVGPRSMQRALPGQPFGAAIAYAPQTAQGEQGTSHISIVDSEGHAVSMTTSIEAAWGSRLMSDGGTGLAGGFLLNNQLTDFSFAPTDPQGRPVANRVQPGKRPRSSMSPTLVFDKNDGRLLMTLGSPGGPIIIHAVAKTLIATLDWGLDVQQAINLPNFANFNGPTALEPGRFPAQTIDALKARGHTVLQFDLTSGLQGITRTPTGWFGGADPRREGSVEGR